MAIKDGWSLENDAKVYLLFSTLYVSLFFFNPLGPEFEAAVVGWSLPPVNRLVRGIHGIWLLAALYQKTNQPETNPRDGKDYDRMSG